MVFLLVDGAYLLTGVNPESLHDVQSVMIDMLKAIRTQLLNYPASEISKEEAEDAIRALTKEQSDKKEVKSNSSNITTADKDNKDNDVSTEMLLSLASGLIEVRIVYFSSAVMQHISEHTRIALISALRQWRFQVHVLESVESRIGSPVDAAMCTRIVQTCYTFHNELLPFASSPSPTGINNTNINTMLDVNVVSANSAGFHHSASNTHVNTTETNTIAGTSCNYLNLHKLFCIFTSNAFISSACDVALSLNFDMTLLHYNTDCVAEELLSYLSPKYANGNGKASIAKKNMKGANNGSGGGVVILHNTAAAIEALEALPITFPNMSLDLQMKIKQMKDLLLSQRQSIIPQKVNSNESDLFTKPIIIHANTNNNNNNNASGLITSNTLTTRAITEVSPANLHNSSSSTLLLDDNKNKVMKDSATEQNKTMSDNITNKSNNKASQMERTALFPFTPPPPLPGLPDPFASDNTMTSNKTQHINDKPISINESTSDRDEEVKVSKVQPEHTPSFSMNLFDNDKANASKAQTHAANLEEQKQQEQQHPKENEERSIGKEGCNVDESNDESRSKSFAQMQKELNELLSSLHKPHQVSTAKAPHLSMSSSEPSLLSLSTSATNIDNTNKSTEKEAKSLPHMLPITNTVNNKNNNNASHNHFKINTGTTNAIEQHEQLTSHTTNANNADRSQSHSQPSEARTTSTSFAQDSHSSSAKTIASNSIAQQQTPLLTRPPKLFTELPPGWQVLYSDKFNRHYFVSKDAEGKNKVQWQHPLGAAAQQRFEKQLEQFKKEQLEYQSKRQQQQQQVSSTPHTSLPVTPTPVTTSLQQSPEQQQQKQQPQTTNLPPNWECKIDPRVNRPFYINHVTHETTWIKPNVSLPQNNNTNSSSNTFNTVLPPN